MSQVDGDHAKNNLVTVHEDQLPYLIQASVCKKRGAHLLDVDYRGQLRRL